jgi:hypothetical protein
LEEKNKEKEVKKGNSDEVRQGLAIAVFFLTLDTDDAVAWVTVGRYLLGPFTSALGSGAAALGADGA